MKLIACILTIASASGEMDQLSVDSRTRPSIKNFIRLGKLEIPNFRVPPAELSIPASRVSDITLTKSLKRISLKIPQSISARGGSTTTTRTKKKRRNNTGFYYGIKEDVFFPQYDKTGSGSSKKKKESGNEIPTSSELADIMGETLLELREMREDISGLREEMHLMKEEFQRSIETRPRYFTNDESRAAEDEEDSKDRDLPSSGMVSSFVSRRKRQREFEAIGADVEKWAHELLFEQNGEEHGWKEVKCNKAIKKKFNRDGSTSCYVKWMKDSRGEKASLDDDQEYPCLKVYSTVNAPLEQVCAYLSDENHFLEYNDLLIAHRELEEITPNAKICWAQSPQILFVKSRDFVTYCQYRWRRDGAQILVNQASEHKDVLGAEEEGDGKICRGAALRGANFISKDPDDPNKTRFALLAHVNPGGGIPHWAIKTVVSALLPIEPFKLFYKIDTRVNTLGNSVRENTQSFGQSSRPAGLSQMGYACFWPACDSGLKGEGESHSGESVEIIHDEAGTAGKESTNEGIERSSERCLTQ